MNLKHIPKKHREWTKQYRKELYQFSPCNSNRKFKKFAVGVARTCIDLAGFQNLDEHRWKNVFRNWASAVKDSGLIK